MGAQKSKNIFIYIYIYLFIYLFIYLKKDCMPLNSLAFWGPYWALIFEKCPTARLEVLLYTGSTKHDKLLLIKECGNPSHSFFFVRACFLLQLKPQLECLQARPALGVRGTLSFFKIQVSLLKTHQLAA